MSEEWGLERTVVHIKQQVSEGYKTIADVVFAGFSFGELWIMLENDGILEEIEKKDKRLYFNRCTFSKVTFVNTMKDVDFEDCIFDGAEFEEKTQFDNCNFRGINTFKDCDLRSVFFHKYGF